MDRDSFLDLLERCLDGTAGAEEQERMVAALRSSDQLRKTALRIAAIDSVLATFRYDTATFARTFVDTISRKGETKEFAVDVVHRLREERRRDDRRRRRTTRAPSRGSRIPWFIGTAAAAAAILLVLFGNLLHRPEPVAPAPPSGKATLAYFREQADRAKTRKDLFALNELARTLYREEVEKGAGCNVLKLVHLGLSVAVTINPKEDRQVTDLRFALERAGKAEHFSATAGVLPDALALTSVAEAATLPLEEHQRFISSYHEARKAACLRKYDTWDKHMLETQKISRSFKLPECLDALFFEYFYVRYYERSLPHTRKEFEKVAAGWPKGSPGREYFESAILEDMSHHAETHRALASNISRKTTRGQPGGRWRVKTDDGMVSIQQTDASPARCSKGFDTPDFQDAILVGLHKLDEQQEYNGPDTLTSFLVYFPDRKETRTWGPGLAKTLSEKWKDQWLWTWHRLRYVGDGIWESQSVYWWEGSQPVAPWEIEEMPEIEKTVVEGTMIDRSRHEWSGRLPEFADGIALATRRTAATWRAMTLHIIKPAPAGEVR